MKISTAAVLIRKIVAIINWRYASRLFGKAFWILTLTCVSCAANLSAPAAMLPVTGAGARVAFLPEQVNFGYLPMGTSGITQTVTLRNDGPDPLVIDHMSISAGFEIAASTCPLAPEAVPSLGTCTVNMVFKPHLTGDWAGHLEVISAAGDQITLKLTGSAPSPLAELMSNFF